MSRKAAEEAAHQPQPTGGWGFCLFFAVLGETAGVFAYFAGPGETDACEESDIVS